MSHPRNVFAAIGSVRGGSGGAAGGGFSRSAHHFSSTQPTAARPVGASSQPGTQSQAANSIVSVKKKRRRPRHEGGVDGESGDESADENEAAAADKVAAPRPVDQFAKEPPELKKAYNDSIAKVENPGSSHGDSVLKPPMMSAKDMITPLKPAVQATAAFSSYSQIGGGGSYQVA